MDLPLSGLSSNVLGVAYGVAGILVAIIVTGTLSRDSRLDAFPAVGSSSSWLGSWWAGLRSLTNSQSVLQEGYDKYKSAPFKFAELNHWTIVLNSREHLLEMARAADDELSGMAAIDDILYAVQMVGTEFLHNPYHTAIIRSRLTRNIEALCPEIKDEIVTSFAKVLDLKENEWKSVPAVDTIVKVVAMTSSRVFVGLPLCRNPDWIDLNIQFTVDIMLGGFFIGLFPKFMRPLVAPFVTKVSQGIARGVKLLSPIIEERQKHIDEYGTEWDGKPKDLLQWFMDEAEGPELTAKRLTTRVMIVGLAAIHSSAHVFTQALFRLAAEPQYIQPLREEVESILEKDGWSKASLGKMRKLDSFLRECQRIEGSSAVAFKRKALKDFVFSDGTFIPKGTSIVTSSRSIHHDEGFYPNPEVFEPFRFAHLHEEEGKGLKHQFVSTTLEYLPFGYGKHACPGRFFAENMIKSLLALTVVTYDVKLEDNATCPPPMRFGTYIAANPREKIMFRKRVN